MTWRERYQQAHEADFKTRYPVAYKDGHYIHPKYPDVNTANGLQKMIENFINWSGYRATRINNIGRLADKIVTEKSGFKFAEKRFTRATRKGQADISSTIKGRSVMWEIKINKDKPSEFQLLEQQKERNAGGEYYFTKTPEDFFELYDGFIKSIS